MKIFLKSALIASTGLAAFLGSGCRAIKPPPSPYEPWEPPGTWKEAVEFDQTAMSVSSPEIDVSQPLALDDVVDIALLNNPATREAWENARAAYARMRQSRSRYYPSLTVGAEAARDRLVADEAAAGHDLLRYGPGSKISMLLLDAGGRRAAMEEAAQEFVARNFLFNRAMQDLILDSKRAYYELYGAEAGIVAAESDVADTEKVLEAARRKLEAGLAVRLDVLQAQSNSENALYALEEARRLVRAAQGNLAKIIGLPAYIHFDIADPDDVIPVLPEDDIRQLIENALQDRPDIAAARAELQSRKFAVKKADSELWPSVSVGGSIARNWYETYGDNPASDNYEYIGYIGINWPLFDGFHNLNMKRAASAAMEADREKLRRSELAASAEVWTKYHAFAANVQKLKYSEAYLSSAEASYALAAEGYGAGLKSILDLLHAQSELSAARSKLVESRKDLYVSLAELAHATGTLSFPVESGAGTQGGALR